MSEIFKGRRFSNRLVFNCPKELEYRVSAAAAAEMSTRGAWLRQACLERLQNGSPVMGSRQPFNEASAVERGRALLRIDDAQFDSR